MGSLCRTASREPRAASRSRSELLWLGLACVTAAVVARLIVKAGTAGYTPLLLLPVVGLALTVFLRPAVGLWLVLFNSFFLARQVDLGRLPLAAFWVTDLVILCWAAHLCVRNVERRGPLRTCLDLPVILLFAVCALSCVANSRSPLGVLIGFRYYFRYVAAFYLIAALDLPERTLIRVVYGILGLLLLQVPVSICQFLGHGGTADANSGTLGLQASGETIFIQALATALWLGLWFFRPTKVAPIFLAAIGVFPPLLAGAAATYVYYPIALLLLAVPTGLVAIERIRAPGLSPRRRRERPQRSAEKHVPLCVSSEAGGEETMHRPRPGTRDPFSALITGIGAGSRYLFAIAAAVGLVGGAVYFAAPSIREKVFDHNAHDLCSVEQAVAYSSQDRGRLTAIQNSWRLVTHRMIGPLMGFGPGAAGESQFGQASARQEVQERYLIGAVQLDFTLVDLGVPGVIVLFWIVFAAYRLNWRVFRQARSTTWRAVSFGLFSFIPLYGLSFFYGRFWLADTSAFLFWFLVACIQTQERRCALRTGAKRP